MIASLYPKEESKTNAEDGFIEGNLVAVKVHDNQFICGKSRIKVYNQYGIKEEQSMTELNKRPPELQPVTVPQFVVNEYNQLKLENITLKARVAELEEKLTRKQEELNEYKYC